MHTLARLIVERSDPINSIEAHPATVYLLDSGFLLHGFCDTVNLFETWVSVSHPGAKIYHFVVHVLKLKLTLLAHVESQVRETVSALSNLRNAATLEMKAPASV